MSLRRTITNLGLDLALHLDHGGIALNHSQEPLAPPSSTKPEQPHHDVAATIGNATTLTRSARTEPFLHQAACLHQAHR